MTKFFSTFLSFITAGFFVLLVFLLIGARGNSNDYVNTQLRPKLDHYVAARDLLQLHDDGDGRFDYLGKNVRAITLEFYLMQGESVKPQVLTRLTDELSKDLGKPVNYDISSEQIQKIDPLSQDALDVTIKTVKPNRGDGKLSVFVLSSFGPENDLLGQTYEENSVVVYDGAIRYFTSKSPQTFDAYQLSTIMHEFGHQLGLAHNDRPGCLMNPTAEISNNREAKASSVVTDFCSYEKTLLAQTVQ